MRFRGRSGRHHRGITGPTTAAACTELGEPRDAAVEVGGAEVVDDVDGGIEAEVDDFAVGTGVAGAKAAGVGVAGLDAAGVDAAGVEPEEPEEPVDPEAAEDGGDVEGG